MKILIINNSSKSIFQFRFEFIKYLIKKKCKVYLFCENDGRFDELKKIGCIIYEYKFNNSSYGIINNSFLLLSIFFYIKKNSFDYVFSYGIKANVYSGIVSFFTSYKSISIITGINTQIFLNKNYFLIYITRFMYFLSDINSNLIFLNKDDKDFYKINICSIRNKYFMMKSEGVNIAKFLNYQNKNNVNEKFTFLLACRLIKHKGLNEYLEVAKLFHDKNIDVNFYIAGSQYKSRNSVDINKINNLHQKKIINYLGEITDIRKIISKSHCVVLPSYREATGMILVEGALMGKPLIASDVPGCNSVVIDNYNGYLVEKGNVNDLFQKMYKMYKLDKEKYSILSSNSVSQGKKFDVKNNLKIYNEILGL